MLQLCDSCRTYVIYARNRGNNALRHINGKSGQPIRGEPTKEEANAEQEICAAHMAKNIKQMLQLCIACCTPAIYAYNQPNNALKRINCKRSQQSIGKAPEQHKSKTGAAPEQHRNSTGAAPEQHQSSTGVAPGQHRGYVMSAAH